MKLKSLALSHFPGFERRHLELSGLHPGVNIIIGPNASGKTSICQAVRRLLWPGLAKHLASASIHSEWLCGQTSFTLAVKSGETVPSASQEGERWIQRVPEENLAPCFSITIDELFDGRDQEFAQRISREIAGGYDVGAARERCLPAASGKAALKDWIETKERLDQFKRAQEGLRQEGADLPALELSIQEAEEARSSASSLEKILQLKKLQNHILLCEGTLQSYPKQLASSKIKATDWENYERLLEKQEALKEEIQALKSSAEALCGSVGIGRKAPEGELDRQTNRIGDLQRLQNEKNETLSRLDKLDSDVQEHRRLLGILRNEDVENIQAVHLDGLEEDWARLDQLDSKIAGLEEQIRLSEAEPAADSEILAEKVRLLTEIASYACARPSGLWLAAGIAAIAAGALCFFWDAPTRFLAFSPLVPVAFLWAKSRKSAGIFRQLVQRHREAELPPLQEWTTATIFPQLRRIVADWSLSRQAEMQMQRENDLRRMLRSATELRALLHAQIEQKAQKAGIARLPPARRQFFGYLKNLHRDWIEWKKCRLDLERVSDRLAEEWRQWHAFTDLFEEPPSFNPYELGRVHERIKNRVQDAAALDRTLSERKKKEALLQDLESKAAQALSQVDCCGRPENLKALVGQLDDYQRKQSELNGLKRQFDDLSAELGGKRSARVSEEFEVLEKEKEAQEEKAKTLQKLSEKKGSLQARVERMEIAMEGEALLCEQDRCYQAVRSACRDFTKKALMDQLIDGARQEFQRECQPPVLEKAVEWFQRFTKSKFRLEAPSTHTGSVVYEVIETSTGIRRKLDELSRGTRMQLLLSVRLAFACQSEEQGMRLPIFLDEVMANTDPDRFAATGEVIGELAAEGRQVFYLTCNPEDAWKWRRVCPDAHLIDLAQIHGEQAFLAAPLPALLKVGRFPRPSCESLDASLYALELKLPALRIDEPVESVSIHYLVDCANDLFRLLHGGIETYGNLKHITLGAVERSCPNSFVLIERRGRLLESFFALKTRGRGKPLCREALLNAGLSAIFLDRIWDLAQELRNDAKSLIAFLADKNKKDERTKRFSGKEKEELNNALIQAGYLDPRPILSDDEIRRELFAHPLDERDLPFLETLFDHSNTFIINNFAFG